MLLTAEEARSKYCCKDITKKCRADDCMGWAWYEIIKIAIAYEASEGQNADIPVKHKQIHKGYCSHLNEPSQVHEYYGKESDV